jgi:hypothetical protein
MGKNISFKWGFIADRGFLPGHPYTVLGEQKAWLAKKNLSSERQKQNDAVSRGYAKYCWGYNFFLRDQNTGCRSTFPNHPPNPPGISRFGP